MNYYSDISKYGDKVALINEENEKVTYNEIISKYDAIFDKNQGKSLIFLLADNNVESIICYLGALAYGHAVALINPEINKALLTSLIDDYKPKYIFAPDKFDFFEMDYTNDKKLNAYLKWSTKSEYEIYNELAVLLTTSGSTGSPKLVRQSYENINDNAKSIVNYLNITSDDIAITTLPMSYTYGLSIINSHLLKGGTIVLNNTSIIQKEFWKLMDMHKVTNFGGVPYTYEILKKLKFHKMNLPHLRYLTQAGGKLSVDLAEYVYKISQEKDFEFIIMYGQTEATARMAYLPYKQLKDKFGSIGLPIPGGQFFIIDDEGNEIKKDNIDGELVYKGRNVTLGYAQSYLDLALGDVNNGILKTGDVAKRDGDDFYYIVGRKKRFLKIYGSRVNLDEIERILTKKISLEIVCSGKDDMLIVYLVDGSEEEQAIIKDIMKDILGINNRAFKVKKIKEIPRNTAGKVIYSRLEL